MDSFTPKYVVIQNYILDKIQSGILKPGDMIPSDNTLAQMFGVSRITVANAISELRLRGIVERVKGKGTYVKKNEAGLFGGVLDAHMSSFKISGSGHNDNHELVALEIIDIDEDMSHIATLKLLPGEKCHRISRLMYSNDEIIAFEYSYIPFSLYPHEIDRDTIETHYLHSFIAEFCNKTPQRLETHIDITYPNKDQQKYLNASADEPLLLWYTGVIDSDGMVLGYTETCARPEDYRPYINFVL